MLHYCYLVSNMLYDGCYPTVSTRSASLLVAIPRLAAISAAPGPGNAPLRLATCANSTGGVRVGLSRPGQVFLRTWQRLRVGRSLACAGQGGLKKIRH